MKLSPLPSLLRSLPALLLLIPLFLTRSTLLGDPGVGWHLRSGEIMLESGSILRTDPFLGDQIRPWIHTQWLADILFALMHRFGGFGALSIFCIAVGVIIVGVLLPRQRTEPYTASDLLILMLCGTLLWFQLFVRPVLWSLLLFALLLLRIYRIRQKGQAELQDYLFTTVLFSLWASLHPGFPFGVALLGIFALSSFRSQLFRGAAIMVALAAAATVLNPYGLTLHQKIIQLTSDQYFMTLNKEWLSPDFHQPIFLPLLIAIALTVFLLAVYGRALSVFELLLTLTFLLLSLCSRRYIPFFGIVLYRPLVTMLNRCGDGDSIWRVLNWRIDPERLPWVPLLTVPLFIGTPFLPGLPFPASTCPASALHALKGQAVAGTALVLNHPDWGGCLAWSERGRVKPWIDDRNELVGSARYKEYFRVTRLEEGWETVLNQYQPRFILLETKSPFSSNAIHVQEYKRVYSDDTASLFERRAQ